MKKPSPLIVTSSCLGLLDSNSLHNYHTLSSSVPPECVTFTSSRSRPPPLTSQLLRMDYSNDTPLLLYYTHFVYRITTRVIIHELIIIDNIIILTSCHTTHNRTTVLVLLYPRVSQGSMNLLSPSISISYTLNLFWSYLFILTRPIHSVTTPTLTHNLYLLSSPYLLKERLLLSTEATFHISHNTFFPYLYIFHHTIRLIRRTGGLQV